MTSFAAAPPALVGLHGFTGSPKSFARLRISGLFAPALGGHGPDPDLSSASFDAEVRRISAAMASRFNDPVHLFGYSMGSRVALALALAHPEQVARLTLIGVNPGLRSEEAREERLDWESRWIDMLEVDGLALFERRWRALPLFDSQGSLPPSTREEQAQERLSHTAFGLAHALRTLGLSVMPNLWPLLPQLKLPCDLIVGSLDSKFSLIAEEIESLVDHCRVLRLPGCGHNPLLETPGRLRSLMLNP